jgi:hypothetical protein
MKLLSIILMVLTLGLTSQAATQSSEDQPTGGSGMLENIFPLTDEQMSLPDFAERLSTPSATDPNASSYTCRAWTNCYNGYRISCWSRGYRCYSEVSPGYRVYCSATSRSGYTEYWVAYCY